MESVKDLVRPSLRDLPGYQLPRCADALVKLDANESPFPLPKALLRELGERLARVPLHRYPDRQASALRRLISDDLRCRPSQLSFGNGSDELIALVATAFSQPRSGADSARILIPTPTFVVYRAAAVTAGLEPVEVPLRDDFTLDPITWHQALREAQPNVVFLARPNNPTGTLWGRQIVEQTLGHRPRCLVVVDEAYVDYSGDSVLDLLAQHSNLLVLRTLSKVGLAGLRIGYAVASDGVIEEIERLRMPYNVNALTQAAAVWLLSAHRKLLEARIGEVIAERGRLGESLSRLEDLTLYPSRGNMLLFRVARAGVGSAAAVYGGLRRRGVSVRAFGREGPLAGCLRVTVGTRAENDLFLSALVEILGGLSVRPRPTQAKEARGERSVTCRNVDWG